MLHTAFKAKRQDKYIILTTNIKFKMFRQFLYYFCCYYCYCYSKSTQDKILLLYYDHCMYIYMHLVSGKANTKTKV